MKGKFKKFSSAAALRIRRRLFSKCYDLVPLEDLEGFPLTNTEKILTGGQVQGVKPIFYQEEANEILGYDGVQISPDIYLKTFSNVTIIGRTEFVQHNRTLYYPKSLDPEIYAFTAEIDQRGRINTDKSRLSIFPRTKVKNIDRAISLIGQCSGNYAHWLTEAIARLVLVDERDDLDAIPIVVDENLHPNLKFILELMNKKKRKIITVRSYQRIDVGTLHYVTLPGITPAETRHFFETGELDKVRPDQYQFSSAALRLLRESVHRRVRVSPPRKHSAVNIRRSEVKIEKANPTNVYLPRTEESTGNGRHLINQNAIEAALSAEGFAHVDVYEKSIEEVIEIFRHVRVVISPIGATLTNLIFSPPGVEVIILTPTYPSASFHYFANLMVALGHKVSFVLGTQSQFGTHSIYNRDYFVLGSVLEKALESTIWSASSSDTVGYSVEQHA
ncbi:glycosyltransferase 61 family protein [Gymnodinialimonas sp. 2305UL16-5]|uniref:glycosyltransferase family 61 protein n=1 Tax=Gymnodinialimonas mytili TaxID=3126503 RepID=UPI00309768E8